MRQTVFVTVCEFMVRSDYRAVYGVSRQGSFLKPLVGCTENAKEDRMGKESPVNLASRAGVFAATG